MHLDVDLTAAVITFLTAFAVSAVSGRFLIPFLRSLKAGQTERGEGPKSHLKKTGTPNMGGLMILLGVTVGSLLPFRGAGAVRAGPDPHGGIRTHRFCRRLYQGGEKTLGRPVCLAEVFAADPCGPVFRLVCAECPLRAPEHEDPVYVRPLPGLRDPEHSGPDLYRCRDGERNEFHRWCGWPGGMRHDRRSALFCRCRGGRCLRRHYGRHSYDRCAAGLSSLQCLSRRRSSWETQVPWPSADLSRGSPICSDFPCSFRSSDLFTSSR